MALTKVRGSMINMADLDLSNVGAIQADSIAGDADTNTSITFSGSDVITIANAGANQLTFNDGSIVPVTDDDIDLGTSVLEFKNAYFDGTVTSDAFAGPLTGAVTGNADTATALAAGRTIGMTGDVVWTSASFTGSGNVTGTATIQATSVTTLGTIATGVWQGTAIASSYIAGDAIVASKIADDAIDSEHYTDGSIDNQHLAGSIANAKLANSSITLGDASSSIMTISLGQQFSVIGSNGCTTSLDNNILTINAEEATATGYAAALALG